jgi:hypothetical protein
VVSLHLPVLRSVSRLYLQRSKDLLMISTYRPGDSKCDCVTSQNSRTCHAMPVIDRQPTNSKCSLARMQSTAAPLSVVVHITAKMGPRAKRKELGRTCMQLESGEQAHFTDPFLTYPFPAPTAAFSTSTTETTLSKKLRNPLRQHDP